MSGTVPSTQGLQPQSIAQAILAALGSNSSDGCQRVTTQLALTVDSLELPNGVQIPVRCAPGTQVRAELELHHGALTAAALTVPHGRVALRVGSGLRVAFPRLPCTVATCLDWALFVGLDRLTLADGQLAVNLGVGVGVAMWPLACAFPLASLAASSPSNEAGPAPSASASASASAAASFDWKELARASLLAGGHGELQLANYALPPNTRFKLKGPLGGWIHITTDKGLATSVNISCTVKQGGKFDCEVAFGRPVRVAHTWLQQLTGGAHVTKISDHDGKIQLSGIYGVVSGSLPRFAHGELVQQLLQIAPANVTPSRNARGG